MQVLGRRDALVLVSLAGLFLLSEGFVLPAQPAAGRRLETCMSAQRSSDEAAPARRQVSHQCATLSAAFAVSILNIRYSEFCAAGSHSHKLMVLSGHFLSERVARSCSHIPFRAYY